MVYQGPLPLVEVSGLRSGLTYRFRVQATNDVRPPYSARPSALS